jgi:leucyl aminopeptidase (aminopeptidase T)
MSLQYLRAIYSVNLAVKPDERVLVFTDKPTKREEMSEAEASRRARLLDIALMTAETGRGISREMTFVQFAATGGHGKEPPARVWEAAFGTQAVSALRKENLLTPILRKTVKPEGLRRAERIIRRQEKRAVDVVIALSNYSTSHTTFRQLLTRVCGVRYASMPLFDAAMMDGAMDVDWRAMARRTKALARVVTKAVHIRITTPEGTDISFSTKGRRAQADTGLITKPGDFGNLPAGEAFLAPVEGTAEGQLVLLWAPTRKLVSPVTVKVAKGAAGEVTGEEDYVQELTERLSVRRENRNIAELGIGTNPRATRPDNILESEKILGTVHMAFGDNSTFGGTVKTPFHQDFVFFRPTLVLTTRSGEEVTLLEEGNPSPEL